MNDRIIIVDEQGNIIASFLVNDGCIFRNDKRIERKPSTEPKIYNEDICPNGHNKGE